ncbi:hypothetical protein Tco_0885000 [Tanacetum coccineum]
MDANKKFDLVNPQCYNESKILANILINHPLRFCVAGSSSVPWICMSQFWHTLKEDGSKYKLKFCFGTKELSITIADFRRIFKLPQATDNNNVGFVIAPTFKQMQTRADYAEISVGRMLKYSRKHPNISRRVHDNYHIVENDDLVKNIFNSRKNKEGAGMKIPNWMLTEEMTLTGHYKMYDALFQIDITNLDETIQISIATQRSIEDYEARHNVAKVKEHKVDEEIEPRSEKESPEVKTNTDPVTVNTNKEEEESAKEALTRRKREKGIGIEEIRNSPPPTPIRSPSTNIAPLSTDK